MDKREIAHILEEIGTFLELKGENTFKVRAYYNAARTIETLDIDLEEAVRDGTISDIKGIGDALTKKLTELITTGKLAYYDDLKASIPSGLVEMLSIQGLGPKKVKAIYDMLGVSTVGELEYACRENRLAMLKGFGVKTQDKVLESIEFLKRGHGLFLISHALEQAEELLEMVLAADDCIHAQIAGSLRRHKEVIKDIDIVAATSEPAMLTKFFSNIQNVERVTGVGDTKASVVLESGIAADLRAVSETEFPYALHHFTGSKEHNTAMRSRAKKMGIKMNEYGLFKGSKLLKCKDESEIFGKLGLKFIPPEMRENTGEIDAAENGQLPKLVEECDIKGVVHVHTEFSDGRNTPEQIKDAADKLGLSFVGISDHSRSAAYAGGMKEADLKKQMDIIDRLNSNGKPARLLKGVELDILKDGSLDFPDKVLNDLDFTIASIHSSFTMGEAEMTGRIIKAIENPYVSILAHPTGRLLLARDAYKVNMNAIIEAAGVLGVAIEINSSPHRLDLDWRLIPVARKFGVKLILSPDAHVAENIDNYRFGVWIARKGWCTSREILNTMDSGELLNHFRKRRK